MATYSVSGNKIVFAGTDITPTFIHTSVNASGVSGASSSKEENFNYGDSYVINANIVIGSSTTTGDETILLIKEDNVTFNSETFDLFGKMQIGDSSTSGNPKETSTVIININNGDTVKDKFILKTDSKLIGFGGTFKHNSRVRCETRCLVDFYRTQMSVADGFSVGEGSTSYGNNQTIKLRYCYNFGAAAVAFKMYTIETNSTNFPVYDITGSVFVDSLYGIQLSAMPVELIDVGLNSNTSFLTPNNQNNSRARILNPDFSVLKMSFYDSNDQTQLLFRYNLKIQDVDGNSIEGARVHIKDSTNLVVSDGLTDANGKVIDFQKLGGNEYLTHSRWAGTTATSHKTTTTTILRYGYQLISKTFDVVADIVDTNKLIEDSNITESTQATVDGYTEINTLEKLYDASINWKEKQENIHKPTAGQLLIEVNGKKLKPNLPNLTLYNYQEFKKSPAYAVGDRCTVSGTFYKCTTATTDSALFNASQWEATTAFEVTSDTITINCSESTSTKFNEVEVTGTVTTNGIHTDWSYIDENGDSTLLFDSIDEWEIYSTIANRAAQTNKVAVGTSTQYRFNYTATTSFYLRVRKGEIWFDFDKPSSVLNTGINRVDYNIEALQQISLENQEQNRQLLQAIQLKVNTLNGSGSSEAVSYSELEIA